MPRFRFVEYDTDDSSVESSSVASSDGSCSLDFSIDGDAFIHDNYFSSDDETTVASRESFIEESMLGDDDDVDDVYESNDEVPVDCPPVVAVAVAIVDIVPPRRSSRLRRKPVRFADEYAKYYC
mmetsp:Transcript_16301/g.24455  ORF Transcript_16301/g.24455 Transcript_16301/m.24455 type:complete len:124 (-) Transcript_16301:70-441(-)|eukprot:CAMPEP_0203685304 /NCGR_PEP_ID=MMETSP0090-20130426/48477_1 /ASSEMBLY_ACC=CAM_ASM_001088 /TAXON_ID=426623 /ORGANISM="Chaetoceros affinis, Strain CCMP159" /LENGTH=123 /DNA_ID=CAMNT_0050554493 /DNA_START=21 /DNA_END=392 /DNA_ORIENTATION=+